jgi:hypothetical protein
MRWSSLHVDRPPSWLHGRRTVIDWILANKEWLFGGIAVAVPLAIAGWIANKRKHDQTQTSGQNSTNIQAGGNVNIGPNDRPK